MRWFTNPVVQFLAAGFVTLLVVVAATQWLSRDAADDEAIAEARALTGVLGRSVAEPAVPRGLVTGDAAAIDKLDRTVLDRLLVGDVERIKIWAADGTVLYSDRTELIGSVYPLDDDEREILERGGTDAELSDLSRPENRFERGLGGGGMLEVYTRIRSPEGQPLLFEAYFRSDQIADRRGEVLDRFLPISIGALLVLVLVTTPLILLLTRRVARGGRDRERLLRAAVQASDAERVRIARDLHDGVVQDLAGSSYSLSTLATRLGDEDEVAGELEEVSRSLRTSMRSLRSLLVEIYPPDLHVEGLAAALHDVTAPLTAAGVGVDVDVTGDAGCPDDAVALVWRVAQEAVRNVARHADARRMSVTVHREERVLVLEVVDDGRGFDPGTARGDGGFGLRGLRSLAADAGARLEVDSSTAAGQSGTTVRLEVPL
ncbi:sensor histidine kinase [Nocardioides sp. MH1]|uniref:sensor histidine kinase n=1 Tax=Nocardioides sp. MH1 TaxID=3242490 RepID=UPI00351FEEA8